MTGDRHFGDLYDRDVDLAAERAYRATQKLPPPPDRRAFPLPRAREIAENLAKVLRAGCDRLEIAGSIRRKVAQVKDIELVAIPRGIPVDLFGNPATGKTKLDVIVDGLLEDGLLEAREPKRLGDRYKALRTTRTGVGVDLFIVRPPAQWGAIFAIRTGGADFSRFCVTEARKHGRRVERGRVVDEAGRTIETPEEADFFRAVRVGFVPPEKRS